MAFHTGDRPEDCRRPHIFEVEPQAPRHKAATNSHEWQSHAHRSAPPHLANPLIGGGLIAFLLITAGWVVGVLNAFRLPRS